MPGVRLRRCYTHSAGRCSRSLLLVVAVCQGDKSFLFCFNKMTLTVTSLCGQKHVRDKPEPGPLDRGRRCYTHLPPGGLALGVIPTGVRLFFFYFLNLGGEGGSGSPRCFFFPVSFLSITSFFLFGFFYGSKKKRNFVVCAAGAGSVDIPYFDSHLHCCGECPGRRGGGVNEKVSECTEKENW